MGLRHLRLRAAQRIPIEAARQRPPPAAPMVAGLSEAELKARLSKLTPEQLKAVAEDPKTKAVLGSAVIFNPKQRAALDLLRGPAKNVLLHGGARSSKTFNIVVAIIERALQAPGSRHAVLRLHHSDVVRSVGMDTVPKAIQLVFPGLDYELNKSDWIYTLSNSSQIMLAGLDTSTRMEKILGLEFASIHLNEISQLTYSAMQFARHRLAQRTALVNKIYADCNPPSRRHWGHSLFIEKRNPENGQPLPNAGDYAEMRLNPIDNRENIAEGFIDDLRASFGTRDQQRYIDGIWGDDAVGSLFPVETLDRHRIAEKEVPRTFQRLVIAVDPSGARGPDDVRSDEIGIVLLGVAGGHIYVLADHSGRYDPIDWGELVVDVYMQERVDAIVVETNYGAGLATSTIRTAAATRGISPRFSEKSASRPKHVRAEPVSTLFEKGLVHLVGRFPDLEAQLGGFTPAGYAGDRSPDRADALVHGCNELAGMVLSGMRQGSWVRPLVQGATLAARRRR